VGALVASDVGSIVAVGCTLGGWVGEVEVGAALGALVGSDVGRIVAVGSIVAADVVAAAAVAAVFVASAGAVAAAFVASATAVVAAAVVVLPADPAQRVPAAGRSCLLVSPTSRMPWAGKTKRYMWRAVASLEGENPCAALHGKEEGRQGVEAGSTGKELIESADLRRPPSLGRIAVAASR